MKYLIIYHNEDNDGLFSAAIIYSALMNNEGVKTEDFTFVGTTYNNLIALYNNKKEFKELVDNHDEIYMTDMSINGSTAMRNFVEMCEVKDNVGTHNKLRWFDHHAPAIKQAQDQLYNGVVPGVRDTSHSAILNVWKWFYNDTPAPELFNILSAWDSFSFNENGYTKDYVYIVNKAATAFYELNLDSVITCVMETLNNTEEQNKEVIGVLEEYGKILADYDDFNNRRLIQNFMDSSWKVGDRTAGVIFTQTPTNSLMFESVKDVVQNGVVFKRCSDGNWVMSMYNTNEEDTFHCGEYLKENYGGGGHSGAAGCTLTEAKFKKLLKSKNI